MENLHIWVALVACWNVSLQQGHLSDVLLLTDSRKGKKNSSILLLLKGMEEGVSIVSAYTGVEWMVHGIW